MFSYRRAVTRLMFVGVLISGAALLNKPAAAVTCQVECSLQYRNCLDNCHGNGECAQICGEADQLCLKGCG